MKHDPRFWDRIADRYYRKPIAEPEIYREKLRLTRELLDADARLLELGCGTGGTAVAHAPHVARVHAVDISERMLELGRAQARREGVDNIVFERADIADFDAPRSAYDAVLGLSVLHLVDDRDETIANVHRMLRPGGVFVSSTVCLRDVAPWFALVAPLGRALGLFPLVRAFTGHELVTSLERAGFEIERRWLPGKRQALFVVARKPLDGRAPRTLSEVNGSPQEGTPGALAIR